VSPIANQSSAEGLNVLHDQGVANTLSGVGVPAVAVHHWAVSVLFVTLGFIAIGTIVYLLTRLV
jgi:hypothetical protein